MSVLEVSRMRCVSGSGDQMVTRLPEAVPNLTAGEGCRGVTILRSVEEPDTFLQLIEWDSVEAHHAWRASPLRDQYRSHVVDLLDVPNEHLHYRVVHESRDQAR